MAEARNAIDLYYLQRSRGLQLGADHEGYYSITLRVPTPSVFVAQCALFFRRGKQSLLNRMWPATPLTVLAVVGGVTVGVVTAGGETWVRSGWLADALWRVDSRLGVYNPLHKHFSTSFRVGYLASGAAFVGMLGIVSVERFLLRLLLSYQGFLFGAKTKVGKVMAVLWGTGVTALSGRKNALYAFDMSLPSQPLPALKDTVMGFFESVKPILSEEEFQKTQKLGLDFLKNEGKTFQRYLWLKHLFSSNYVTDWWEKYCYLYGRTPIMVNSNYYVLDAKERPTVVQVQRCANLMHQFLRFKDLVEDEVLEPMTIRGAVQIPLCMKQYERMFGTTRIPGRECDRLQHTFKSRHVVVISKGHYYKLDVYHGARGTQLRPYSCEELEVQLALILEHSKRQSAKLPTTGQQPTRQAFPPSGRGASARIQSFEDLVVLEEVSSMNRGAKKNKLGSHSNSVVSFQTVLQNAAGQPVDVKQLRKGSNIAAFTAGPRSRWAEVRETYFSEGLNRKSLDAIETAAFVVFLEDTHFTTLNERAASLFHGTGSNRWFDKSINLVVFEDGYAGLNCEHSWADAPAIAHLWEYSLLNELIEFEKKRPKKPVDTVAPLQSDPAKTEQALAKASADRKLPIPKRLLWEIDDELQVAIDNAHQFAITQLSDVELEIVEHLEYGKGFIKKCGMSPDGYVQMALQLAYYRDQGHFDLTYESSMARLFRLGRTETTRSLGAESVAFVEALEQGKPKQEVIKLLKAATFAHGEKNKRMMVGQGIDRHLFALYIVSKGLDRQSDFLIHALTMPWRLSTSQQPQDQTLLRAELPKEVAQRFVSPGGGFGPVADDGYGVSYMFAGENQFFFHISSKISKDNTSSGKFKEELMRALDDIANLFR